MTSSLFFTILSLLLSSLMLDQVNGYEDRVPVTENPEICETMEPAHNVTAQTDPCPYRIQFNTDGCYLDHTQKIHVTVYHSEQRGFFEGMFLQARRPDGSFESVGRFENTDDPLFKPYSCGQAVNNTYGHSGHKHFPKTTLTWTPPQGFDSDVQFVATMVRNTKRFWLNVRSSVLKKNVSCTVKEVTDPVLLPAATSRSAGLITAMPLFSILLSLVVILSV